jgi:transcription-repair coupling factor (superfamily II helicase)
VNALRGVPSETDETDAADIRIELDISAYIPDAYVSDEILKLQLYKKISFIENEEDAGQVRDELIDRFGKIPKVTEDLIRIARIRSMSAKAGIVRIRELNGNVVLEYGSAEHVKPAVLADAMLAFGERLRINGSAKPYLSLPMPSAGNAASVLGDVLELLKLILM